MTPEIEPSKSSVPKKEHHVVELSSGRKLVFNGSMRFRDFAKLNGLNDAEARPLYEEAKRPNDRGLVIELPNSPELARLLDRIQADRVNLRKVSPTKAKLNKKHKGKKGDSSGGSIATASDLRKQIDPERASFARYMKAQRDAMSD